MPTHTHVLTALSHTHTPDTKHDQQEWTPSAAEALRISIAQNDTWSLDGRDPSGYVGCMWSVAGVHDMVRCGWGGRPLLLCVCVGTCFFPARVCFVRARARVFSLSSHSTHKPTTAATHTPHHRPNSKGLGGALGLWQDPVHELRRLQAQV